jgi:predicted nucleotidyltransferase
MPTAIFINYSLYVLTGINMYKLKLTLLQQDVLGLLFAYPEKSFTGRAISLSLGVSQPGVSKALRGLNKYSLITLSKDEESKRLTIRLNRDNDVVTGIKRADNLRNLYETGLVRLLEDQLEGATITLFGSYSRGDDTSASDIDIAVIGRKEKNIDLSTYEKLLKRKITIQFYQSLASVHKELRENLCNGIVLSGGIVL